MKIFFLKKEWPKLKQRNYTTTKWGNNKLPRQLQVDDSIEEDTHQRKCICPLS